MIGARTAPARVLRAVSRPAQTGPDPSIIAAAAAGAVCVLAAGAAAARIYLTRRARARRLRIEDQRVHALPAPEPALEIPPLHGKRRRS